jgi:hypothetical protein
MELGLHERGFVQWLCEWYILNTGLRSLGVVVLNVARNELFAVVKQFNTSAVITISKINNVCV